MISSPLKSLQSIEVLNAIYERRAVRRYKSDPIERKTIEQLIDAAIQAPSSMNRQPWAFVVIEGAALLERYSSLAKAYMLAMLDGPIPHPIEALGETVNVFHGAPLLIVVCATSAGAQAAEDCCLAAQNLMLAAFANGLATCPIGLARPWLARQGTKDEIGIRSDLTPVFPLIVGVPDEAPVAPAREPARIQWIG